MAILGEVATKKRKGLKGYKEPKRLTNKKKCQDG